MSVYIESPGDFVQIQILVPEDPHCGPDSAFLTNSQVMLILLAYIQVML